MRALKFLIAGLSVLIIAGFAVIVVTLVNRAGTAPEEGPPDVQGPFAPPAITVPAGSTLHELTVGDGRLVARLSLPGGGDRLLFIGMADGALIGWVDLLPGAPGAQ